MQIEAGQHEIGKRALTLLAKGNDAVLVTVLKGDPTVQGAEVTLAVRPVTKSEWIVEEEQQ